jgi:Ca-activated chloride channel homolog
VTTVGLASPLWLLLLVPLALRLYLAVADRRRGEGAFVYSSLAIVGARRSFAARTLFLPFVLEMVAWGLLIVALARPQRITTIVHDREGIDIVIALDASGSMAAEDFTPRNRFTVAKELIRQFIERRENDRIGIVTFGARAATRVPVTFDRQVASAMLEASGIGENGDGTAIGQAIATSVNRLRQSEASSRIVVLVTDGVNNSGAIEPEAAAALAAAERVKIYTVGVGSKGAVPIPVKVQNRFTGEIEAVYQLIRADLDEEMLEAIASTTGGAYFRAVDPRALEQVLRRIDELERSRLDAPRTRTVEELYGAPLAWGLTFLAAALLAGETRWMRLPA